MATKSAATPKKTSATRPKRATSKATPTKTKAGAKKQPPKTRRAPAVTLDTLIDGVGVVLFIVGLLTGLAMLPSGGASRVQPWLALLARGFGALAVAAPIAMMAAGLWLMARRFRDAPPPPWYRLFGVALFGLAVLGLLAAVEGWRDSGSMARYGGAIGAMALRALVVAIGDVGATVALLGAALLGLLFAFELSLEDLARMAGRLRGRLPRRKPRAAKPAASPSGAAKPAKAVQLPLPLTEMLEQTRQVWHQFRRTIQARRKPEGASEKPVTAPPRPTPAPSAEAVTTVWATDTAWKLPPWRDLLEEATDTSQNDNDIRRKVGLIEETLAHFGVPARVVEINQGPTVTQYGVEPGFQRRKVRGEERDIKVKVSAISNLQNDLALALSAQRIRIEAPVPGRGYVGIEVPNDRANAVTLRDTMESDEFQTLPAALKVALGRDVMGNAVVADLARMPHLLIAGATGSGKSVCINTVISSLICHNTPEQLKLLMVDPKMVELVGYNGIPHLIVPVVTEIDRVVGLLRWTVNEMERRYKIFSAQHVRNVQGFNAKAVQQGDKPLPYLVLIIDELADLMMAAADQVEAMICRLAQMARATGIHLILATQRPSVDVVTGLIKANFPARIAFAVTSQIDSRVILDRPGAESLLGRGDMLYMASDSGSLVRAQGCFVGDRELEGLNRFWQVQAARQPATPAPARGNASKPQVEPVQAVEWDELLGRPEDNIGGDEDDLLPQAREIVRKAGSASVSMLQRRLRIGYARAARLVDLLEAEGSIGASVGPGKLRAVHREEVIPGSDDDAGYDPKWVDEN